ncbi:hypothetical protein PVAP13_3NG079517 [Panicum virgatum]|uniref:Uncharacterized protein n=1 Tax=Panicum virgatum TaxID=38727 RepID=A0A8T0U921_PANVG|nr:hypothetical protein PVAP13_3NG079517 [Panicum virgatum]
MRRQRSPSAAGPVLLLPAVPARRARPARRRRSPPRLRPVSVAPRRWPAGGMRGPSTPTGGRPSATSSTAPEALASWPLLPVSAGHEARAAGPAPPLPVQEREAALVDGRTWELGLDGGGGRWSPPPSPSCSCSVGDLASVVTRSLCPSARASRRSRFQPSANRGEGGAGSAPLEPGATELGGGGVVEAQAVPPLQPSLRPTERGGVGGGGAAAVRHEVEGGRRRGWRVGEGGGGRRDEQSLPSMLG